MSQDNIIEVMGRDGWRKEFPLQKAIVFIGSDPGADIPLEGGHGAGIAPRHLQLIAAPDAGYRLVNLGDSEVLLGVNGERKLASRFSAELTDGDSIRLGDFVLIFRGEGSVSGSMTGMTGGAYGHSKHIGLRVSLPQKQLAPHRSLEGIVTVSNLGDYPGAQFELALEGLDSDYFELEPGPLLSSGAEKEVFFRLYHRGTKPLAGDYRLTFHAVAPKAYPTEQASVAQVVRFLPLYEYKMTLLPAGAKPAPEAVPPEPASQTAPTRPVAVQRPPVTSAPPLPLTLLETEALPQPEPTSSSAAKKSWWSRLTQSASFLRPAPATPSPPVEVKDSARPESPAEAETPPVETAPPEPAWSGFEPAYPPDPAETFPQPVAEPETSLPPVEPEVVVEPPPAPKVQPKPEPPTAPKIEPKPEPPPVASSPPPAQVEKKPAPAAKTAATGPQTEPPPVTAGWPAKSPPAAAPSTAEDWWTATPPEQASAPAAGAAASNADDWWTAPESAPARPASRPALKLKATPEAPPEKTPDWADTSPPTENWWTSPAADSTPPPPPSQKRKTKAKTQD